MGGGRAVVALLTAVALASGCDGPSDHTEPPRSGACYDLDPDAVARPTNDSDPVPCTSPHTAQTFLVGTLPASTGKAYRGARQAAWVWQACTRAFAAHLGADESLALRTRLSWAWFGSSKKAWDAGARWFRCDVVGGQPDDESFKALPRTTRDLLADEELSAWMSCARGAVLARAAKVFCSQRHDWRAVTAIKIGQPEDPYPGDRISEVRARDGCSDWVGAWLRYPTDYEYGYSIFHEAEWKAGNRRALCWARTDK